MEGSSPKKIICESCDEPISNFGIDNGLHSWCGYPPKLTDADKFCMARYAGNALMEMSNLRKSRNQPINDSDERFCKMEGIIRTFKGANYIIRKDHTELLRFAQTVTEWPIYREAG